MSDTTKPTPTPTPAQALHAAGFERLKAELQPQFDAARGSPLDSSVNGRAVGARPAPTPIVAERIFQLPPDNGSDRDIAKP